MLYIKLGEFGQMVPGQKLSKNCPDYVQEEFAKYIAKVMRDEIKKAITKQRFKTKWPPLSARYLDYKKEHHLSMNIWEATGLLKKSIVYRKRNGYYYVGVDPYKRYKNGPKVELVAHVLEYGNDRTPARPLFRPIFKDISKHMGRHWKTFLRKNGYKQYM